MAFGLVNLGQRFKGCNGLLNAAVILPNGNLMKVRSSGGPVQTIVPVTLSARGASWGSKNVIVYSRTAGGPLWRVNADGSGASVLTDKLLLPDERSHRWPMFLPDGDRFLFWAGHFSKEGARSGIYLSSLSKGQKAFVVAARSPRRASRTR